MLYLAINNKTKEEIRKTGTSKYPYLKLLDIEVKEGETIDWTAGKEVAAAWMTKSKKGFNMKLNPGWHLVFKETPEMQTERENRELKEKQRVDKLKEKESQEGSIDYPDENIDPNDIPF